MPFVPWRKSQAVSPVRIVRHQAAAGRTADQRTQRSWCAQSPRSAGSSRSGGGLRPAVEAQHRRAQIAARFQQRLVQRHVERGVARAGVEEKPSTFDVEFSTLSSDAGSHLDVDCWMLVVGCFRIFSISPRSGTASRSRIRRNPACAPNSAAARARSASG